MQESSSNELGRRVRGEAWFPWFARAIVLTFLVGATVGAIVTAAVIR